MTLPRQSLHQAHGGLDVACYFNSAMNDSTQALLVAHTKLQICDESTADS